MKLPSITARDRRAVRLGALLLAPALAYGAIARPYVATRAALTAELEQERELLGRERSLLLSRDAVLAAGERAAANLQALTPLLFTGRDPTAQSGALAALLRRVADRSGVRVNDLRVPVTDSAVDGLQMLLVEFRGTSDLEGIATMLRELETGPRLVAIRRLIMSRTAGPGHDDEVEAIDVALLVQGFASMPGDTTAGMLAANVSSGEAR